jgi:hypothetical protein
MGLKRNFRGEVVGNFVTMRKNVADVPGRKPHPCNEREQQRAEENGRENLHNVTEFQEYR